MFRYQTYLMSHSRQADLLREAEHERLARLAERQDGAQKFYYRWASQFGAQMMRWGQSLQRYSEAPSSSGKLSLNPGGPSREIRSLKVVHASPMRRAKWN
jgi:hypothetical protein